MAESVLINQIAVIGEALESGKVDAYIRFQFKHLQQEKNFDPNEFSVPFLAKVKDVNVELKYVQARVGIIYSLIAPWSALPSIIENPGVISLDGSF